jgi:hypothetical protein
MGDVLEFSIPCHPFNPQIREVLRLESPTYLFGVIPSLTSH